MRKVRIALAIILLTVFLVSVAMALGRVKEVQPYPISQLRPNGSSLFDSALPAYPLEDLHESNDNVPAGHTEGQTSSVSVF